MNSKAERRENLEKITMGPKNNIKKETDNIRGKCSVKERQNGQRPHVKKKTFSPTPKRKQLWSTSILIKNASPVTEQHELLNK